MSSVRVWTSQTFSCVSDMLVRTGSRAARSRRKLEKSFATPYFFSSDGLRTTDVGECVLTDAVATLLELWNFPQTTVEYASVVALLSGWKVPIYCSQRRICTTVCNVTFTALVWLHNRRTKCTLRLCELFSDICTIFPWFTVNFPTFL